MRKYIITTLLFILAVFSSQVFADKKDIKYPSYTGLVNDFASIIEPAKKTALEQRLRDYERKTTIEMAVLTTQSLDGLSIEQFCIDHAHGWGVGKKGKNNGILICVAPTERKYRIEVGYGLEGDLPDSLAGSLGREHLVPYFRAGDYGGGIIALADGIIENLGEMGPEERLKKMEERQALAAQEAERRKREVKMQNEQLKTFGIVLAAFILLAALLTGIYFAIRSLAAAYREWSRKRFVREGLASARSKQTKMLHDFETSIIELGEKKKKSLPKWAQSFSSKSLTAARRSVADAMENDAKVDRLAKDSPDEAVQVAKETERHIAAARSAIEDALGLPAMVKRYEHEAPKKVMSARAEYFRASELIEGIAKKGFRMAKQEELLNRLKTTLDNLLDQVSKESELANLRENCYGISDSASETEKKIAAVAQSANAIVAKKAGLDKAISSAEKELSSLEGKVKEHESVIETIKASSPPENWKDLEKLLDKVPAQFKDAKSRIESAEKKATMESQDFDAAEKEANAASAALEQISAVFASIKERKQEIAGAKQTFKDDADSVERVVSQAASKVSDGDVESGAKKKAKDAKSKHDEAKKMAGNGGLVNWLIALATLYSAKELAEKAIKEAGNDIEEAASARRRRSSSSSGHYSSGGYSSGSSDSGGPSSFGGGNFGGGGASGSW